MTRFSPHRRIVRTSVATGAAVLAALSLTACGTDADPATAAADVTITAAPDAVLAPLGLDGLDARDIIDALDSTALADRTEAFRASVRPDALVITDADQNEASVPMPDDEFYVSIAPYVDQTHECYFHSLTTCTGELQNVDVDVIVVDADGATVLDQTLTTFDNGFVGLWLPRDLEGSVTIEYDGRSATTDLSTAHDDDATCITTMRLA